ERLSNDTPKRQKPDADAQQEQEQAGRRDRRAFQDVGHLAQRQLEQENLKHEEQYRKRAHGYGHARECVGDLGDYGCAHDSKIPTINMTKIGPMEANPSSPKPSDTADRPARTEVSPLANAIMTGAVSTPVVTLPASKATGTKSGGAKAASTRM